MPITGFKQWTCYIGSNCSANWVATSARGSLSTLSLARDKQKIVFCLNPITGNVSWIFGLICPWYCAQQFCCRMFILPESIFTIISTTYREHLDSLFLNVASGLRLWQNSWVPLTQKVYTVSSNTNYMGGSPGLVVMGGGSRSKGRGFESRHHILDGHFSHIFVVKICNVCLKRPKIIEKEARVGPLKNTNYLHPDFFPSHYIVQANIKKPAVDVIKLFLEEIYISPK